MGTFSDSKIRKCRIAFECPRCNAPVPRGAEYLNYKWGQRNTTKVCLSCAENCTHVLSFDGHQYRTHVYRFCADMIQRFGQAPNQLPV